MSDCAYGSNSPLGQWYPVKISGCAYRSSSSVGQVMSVSKAFLLLVRVRLANKSRLILVGAAVSFVRVLALATVVVIFSTVARVMADTSTEFLHSTLQGRHLRGAFPAYFTQGVLVDLQVDPDLVYSMALSGVHQIPICVVINKDPFASDMGAVTMTKTDVVTAPQTHTPSDLTNALTKMPLTA